MSFIALESRLKKAAAVLMTAVLSFVVAARGEMLCLCEDDPDGCGHPCHECGAASADGLSDDQGCRHLTVGVSDLMTHDDAVRTVCVLIAAVVPAEVFVVSPCLCPAAPCAASPPLAAADFRTYSIRLFPRS